MSTVIPPLTPEDGQSKDLVAENIARLKQLFPEIVTDGKVDFDQLREVLGDYTDERQERYSFTWNGKQKAKRLANTKSMGTLRPAPDESVKWDRTENLFIEGDNLEVLKLLQRSYHKKVKMIYIDPPYNTGKDFVYPDDYKDNIKNYLRQTGQVDEHGKKTSSNPEYSGRYHTDWLNMMYPRLKLARELLKDDGVIFISIDDSELYNLINICNEIYGEENFLEIIIWKKRSTPPNDKIIGANHDYIIIYSKSTDHVNLNLKERSQDQIDRYKNPDNHPKGPWTPGDLMANIKGGRYVESLYYPIKNPKTGEEHYPSSDGNWRFNKDRIQELLDNNEIYFGVDGTGRPKLKRFLKDIKSGITYPTIWDFVPLNTKGSQEISEILGNLAVFDNPKPTGLIEEIISLGSSSDCIIMDFFAGSGTTGHAVWKKNFDDNGNRKFILVQLPEKTSKSSTAHKKGFNTISEISIKRLETISNDSGSLVDTDLGFKVFKLDSSNIKPWEPDTENLQLSLEDAVENIKPERSELDVLYEILLKYGLDLSLPIEEKQVAGARIFIGGAGALVLCLSGDIGEEVVQAITEIKESYQPELMRVVFRDSGFRDDVLKTNALQQLKQHGIEDVRSI